MPNHVWHGLKLTGHPLNGLTVSGSLLPKDPALPRKHLTSCAIAEAWHNGAWKWQGMGKMNRSRESLRSRYNVDWIQYNSHQYIPTRNKLPDTPSWKRHARSSFLHFIMELPTLLRPRYDSDHGRCTHQNGKFLLHWPSVCFHQCIPSLQLSLLPAFPQTHRHSLVIRMTMVTCPLSHTIYAHTFPAILTCLHLCSPPHRLILASAPRQGAREGDARNIRLSQTFSVSNTQHHTEKMTQKRSQSNP